MKILMPVVLFAALLCGCPESKIPKAPPKAPEPKLSSLLIDASGTPQRCVSSPAASMA